MSVAFVLTGGGALGAVQVGMLQALHGRGVRPDLLVGTSVGAVNAAYLAGPGTAEARLVSLTSLWSRLRRRDVFAGDPRRWLGAAVGAAPSLFSAAPLRLLLEQHLGYDTFEEARIPVHVTATDVVTGRGVMLSTGPVVSAVLASAAVPGLLRPVSRDGCTLVDGAVGGLDALTYADGLGVDDIYLLPAGYPCAGPPPSTAGATALTALSLLLHRELVRQVRGYAGDARLHVIPPLCPLSASPADFSRPGRLITRGYRVTDSWLARGSDSRNDPAAVLALHDSHEPRPAAAGSEPTPLTA